jgi:Na+-translocating ferredoxin:NAD+ oxidoreductase subunit G
MIRTLGVVATVCGMLLVLTYQNTLEAINANKRIALERAVFKVIPGATSMQAYIVSPAGLVRLNRPKAKAASSSMPRAMPPAI